MVILEKKMTWKEFREMEIDEQDNSIYELINGILMRRTSPILPHQRVSKKLDKAFGNFLDKHPIGEHYPAPTDVFLDDNNGIVPDFSFVSKVRSFLLENDEYISGAPDIIVEIISPGTVKRDRVEKKELYEKFAVKEYWLIDPANKSVEIFTIEENKYELKLFLEAEDKLTSDLLPGFEMELTDLFD
jgi:Uma2 family endonuclease